MTRVFLSPPHLSGRELELVGDAFESNWIAPLGPHVDAFERALADYVGVPHAVALSSGTAGLHLALQVAGVKRGDAVLSSTLTFCATANAICYLGARPVFIDSDQSTWNMDPALLEQELEFRASQGRRVAAVVVVDLYGQSADYERIEKVCQRFDVPLIEDAAEALGATYKHQRAGSFGGCAVFSFNGNKIITTSGGGMLVSHDKAFTDRVRHLATQAREPAAHYEHREVGYNYRLSNILAAIGRAQLAVLDERVNLRRAHFQAYQAALGHLPGIRFMPEAAYGRATRWLTCLTIDPFAFGCDRDHVRLALERADIEARPVWKPLHRQPAFAGAATRGGAVAEQLFDTGLCLPSGSNLTSDDRDRIIEIVVRCHRG